MPKGNLVSFCRRTRTEKCPLVLDIHKAGGLCVHVCMHAGMCVRVLWACAFFLSSVRTQGVRPLTTR